MVLPFDTCRSTAYLLEHYMMRYIRSLVLGTCFVVWLVLPVSADWEFTKWGMSPEQVVQASKGKARPPGPEEDISTVLLTQDWQSGRFLFTVSYIFNKHGGGQRLGEVKLQLQNTQLRGQLLDALKEKYGTPRDERRGPINLVEWQHSGDSIHYLTDLKDATILYQPLRQ